ncbi:MAG: coenzyme F420-0:L-glutamate ligase [Caldilineaceae bacterium]
MKIQPIMTRLLLPGQEELLPFLDEHLPSLPEKCIVAVTSKIVALCQGRVAAKDQVDEAALIEQEAERYFPTQVGRYKVWLTIKGHRLIPNAGVDESNGAGYYVLWPQQPQQAANQMRQHLQRRHGLTHVGVIITDSNVTPLRMGVTGVALAHSGFRALRDYRGANDLFGRPLRMTTANIGDALAAAAVLVMGEGAEQTPLALITGAANIEFQDGNPSAEELKALAIAPEDDLFAPLLTAIEWISHTECPE